MHSFFCKLKVLFIACRGYSIPISIISWLVPFICAMLNGGNILFGFVSLIGIILLHMGTNLFDDALDYTKEKYEIDMGYKSDFNFQKGKCICIINNSLTLKQAYLISFILFFAALFIGFVFFYIWGLKLLYVIIPTAIICLLYPVLGCFGLGEILVSLIFSPLIYSGVYFVMCGSFSVNVLIFSISTGLLSVAVLHNHMLLDYKYDTTNRKITLCNLCGSEKNAYILLVVIVTLAYINLLFWVFSGKLSFYFLLPFITIFNALSLFKVMKIHINNPDEKIKYNISMGFMPLINKAPVEQRNFLMKFMLVQNILISFTFSLCISIVISCIMINN